MIRRTAKLLLEIVAALVIVAAVLTAALAWRLSAGPISLSFLTPLIQRALTPADGAVTVYLDDTVLAWAGWRRNLDIRVRGVSVLGKDGALIAQVPEVTVGISVRALLRGMLAPTSLEVIAPRLALVRNPEGKIEIPREEDATGNAASVFPLLIANLTSLPDDYDDPLDYLKRVSMLAAEVTVRDAASGRVLRVPQADIVASRDVDGLRIQMSLTVELGRDTARIAADGIYSNATELFDATVSFADLRPESLAAAADVLAPLSALKLPIGGQARIRVDAEGRLHAAAFDLTGGEGRIADPRFYPEGLDIRAVRMNGHLSEELDDFILDQATIDLGGPTLHLAGRISGFGARPRLAVNAALRDVPTDDLRRLWPQSAGVNARRWVVANLSEGKVGEFRLEAVAAATGADLDSLALESFDGVFDFTGLSVGYLSPMPRVRGVRGTAKLTDKRLDFAIAAGGIGSLRVDEGKIGITGLDVEDQDAAIELVVRGPLRETLQLVDGPPLGFVKKIDARPEEFSGDGAIRMVLKFPLANKLKLDQIDVAVAANVAGFGRTGAALGQDAHDGTLALRLDQRGMAIDGRLSLGPVPAEIHLTRSFLVRGPVVGEVKAKARLGTADRATLGFDAVPYVNGPVDIDLLFTERRDRRNTVALALGLDGAKLDVAELDWSKPAGVPGAGRIEMTLVGDRPEKIDKIELDAGGLMAKGRLAFADDGKTPSRVELDTLRVGATDARLIVTRAPGEMVIDASGFSLDIGPLMRDRSPSNENRPALSLEASLDRLYLAPDRRLDKVRMNGRRSSQRWETMQLAALLPIEGDETKPFILSLTEEGGRQKLHAETENAGALFKVLDVTPNVIGGRLDVNAATDESRADRALVGKLRVREFRVVNAPVLAQVLGIALLTGVVDSLRGEGIGFTRLDADFAFADSKLEIKEALAHGSSLGITAKGMLDLDAETIDIDGTLVPAYLVNSLIGDIPIIGSILVGGRGGGVIATNYKLSGPFQNPKTAVNPLSTLAPGFLRNLFGILDGGKSPEGFDPQPNPAAKSPTGAPPASPPTATPPPRQPAPGQPALR
ncbi:MAG: AsmA-like C-terminal domain-containing protein [Rhodospirillales bacterium]|nr:AsmA-like C-terminal domain-containing protein [Rhodospirillales bacterium]